MIKVLFTILLSPAMLTAQEPKPYYKNDTLYTTCGYKIYTGQLLQFAKGTGAKGKFRFVKINNDIPAGTLTNNSIVVKDLKNFGIPSHNNGHIELTGTIIFKDSSKGNIDITLAFDRAIENSPDLPTELVVPAECRNNSKIIFYNKLDKLFKLYAMGTITKTEYEAQKKKLLEQSTGVLY